MRFERTPIDGLWQIEAEPRRDERGSLTRLYCAEAFAASVGALRFVQTNRSLTRRRGTVRGMHVQRAPGLEAKLIHCLRGRVFDVAVDLRRASLTFGRWHAVELSDENQRQVLIPAGCAHGFQTLADRCELLYQHTAPYTPACEDGVRHDDPRLAIAWPEPVTELSGRDRAFRLVDDGFEAIRT